jgi:SHO1 osmosensor
MPSPGGYQSPSSLQKMDMGNGRYSGAKGFSMGNIAGDPFWLGSIGIGIVSLAYLHTHNRMI